jgi:O-antigen/teichoic acid export membrane protein
MSIPADSSELTRSFRRGFAATFAVDLVTKALGAATVVVLIRGLSVASFAYTTLFLTLAQFAGSAAGGGVRTRYLREEAERLSRGGEAAWEVNFLDALFKGTILVLCVAGAALPIVAVFHIGSQFAGPISFVAYATAFAAGLSAAELTIARYQARRRFLAAGMVSVIRAAALLGAALMILATAQSVLAISLWLVASMVLVGAVTAGPIAYRGLTATLRRSYLSWFDREEIWLSLYYVAAAGFAYVDVMVAGALLSQHQVATLGASLRYLAIVQSPIPAFGAVLRVRTSQIDLIDSLPNQRAMVLTWLKRTSLPAALVVGGTALLAPLVIPQIDSGKYPGSIVVLQIFLVTALSAYLTAPSVSILMAQRRYLLIASIYAAGLLLNLAGDVAVARRFGLVGIAIVSSAIYVALDVALTTQALRYVSRSMRAA